MVRFPSHKQRRLRSLPTFSRSDFDEGVVSLVHFSAAMMVEACVRCLRVILPDFNSPTAMPEVMSARYRMCSSLANACQVRGAVHMWS